jgi:hypothetical protein
VPPGSSGSNHRSGPTGAERAPGGPQPAAGDPDEAPPPTLRKDVDYKGGPLDAEKGPGLGCFWLQVVVLAVVVVLTPLSAAWEWPVLVTIVLLAMTLVLLLFVGQTIIFLLRLVAADRRSDARRRPLRSETKTVGEIEDEARAAAPDPTRTAAPAGGDRDEPDAGGVRE